MGNDLANTYKVEIPDVGYFERQVSCRLGCAVHTDASGYVQAIGQGRYEDAYIIARTPNPFASICGRVCAAPCETKCRRGAIDAAISIRALKGFVCEHFGVESGNFDLGRVYPRLRDRSAPLENGHKVAVVGAGPALDKLGERRSPEWIIEHFRNPQAISPGSVMPQFEFSEQEIRARTEFLLSLTNLNIVGFIKTPSLMTPVERGKAVYKKYGCAGCHGKEGKGGIPILMPRQLSKFPA